jgi:hypothetical protein
MLRDSFGLATAGGGVNNVRVGLKMTENNVGGDDDAMPGMTGKKDADRDEDRAVGLDPADRARISHTQSGRGGKREIELRTRPVEDLNSEDGEDRLSAAALRRKSHKLRRMRKRWGADLKGDDPRDVVARELKTALVRFPFSPMSVLLVMTRAVTYCVGSSRAIAPAGECARLQPRASCSSCPLGVMLTGAEACSGRARGRRAAARQRHHRTRRKHLRLAFPWRGDGHVQSEPNGREGPDAS